MTKIITRNDVENILIQWQKCQIKAQDLHDWAENLYLKDGIDYEDWEQDESYSVTNEVLGALDMMDMNLMTPEDVPAYLEFLKTPLGCYNEGYSKLEQYLQQIDVEERRRLLSENPFYSIFCK